MPISPRPVCSNNNLKQNKKPVTIDELAKMIETLSTNQNKSFESINTRIDDIKKHLSNLDSALVDCTMRVERLEDRVLTLETQKLVPNKEQTELSMEIINEVIEIQKRTHNIIIHGVEESLSKDMNECIIFDTEQVNKLLSLCSAKTDNVVDIIRLGRPSTNKFRPIKLTLHNHRDVDQLISSFLKLKRESPSTATNISFVKDRTLTERRYIKEVYTEFHNQVNAGATDIKIIYSNGIPKIVKTKKN